MHVSAELGPNIPFLVDKQLQLWHAHKHNHKGKETKEIQKFLYKGAPKHRLTYFHFKLIKPIKIKKPQSNLL